MAFIPLYDSNPLRHIRRPWVAWGMIAANVFVFFVLQGAVFSGESREASVFAFGLIPSAFTGTIERPLEFAAIPDWATLFTYAFLHGDIWHLAGNMIFLWVFADNVEDALGHLRYFVFYMLCAAVAGYAFVLSDPSSQAPVIGASGAVAGNIGAYLLLHPRAKIWILIFFRIPLRLRAYWVIGFWIVFQIASALAATNEDDVAWWAHIGGLAAGAILVLFMRQPGVPLFAPAPNEPTARAPAPAPAPRPPPLEPPSESRGPWS